MKSKIGEIASDLTVLGSSVSIMFNNFGKEIYSKVDTGATMSSLHATNIQKSDKSVTFNSPDLSDNVITLDLQGNEEILSADGDGDARPIVKLNISINGKQLTDVLFNLNDRSEMNSGVLIGKNILKRGEFTVDVSNESANFNHPKDENGELVNEESEKIVLEALEVLAIHDVSMARILKFINLKALKSLS